jgi:dienelactone hydrolase
MKTRFVMCLLLVATLSLHAWPKVSELPVRRELPDPLVLFDGKPVTSKGMWQNRRRAELKLLFEHYEYGTFPPVTNVTSRLEYVDKTMFGGKATLKLVTIRFGQREPRIDLMVVIPNHRTKPAPVFLGMNFGGNYALVTNTMVPLPRGNKRGKEFIEADRAKQLDVWNIEQSIDRGYAVATCYCNDVEPDAVDATNGVREILFPAKGTNGYGTIAAWAWGLQRIVDYLSKEKNFDSHRIAVVGHSRLGKAAIVAAAFDDRIAMAIPLQSGTGGTAPSRGNQKSESVARINTSFPHWFCDEFKKFNDQPERLPFDQNCLIAICAPRPVLVSCATGDLWANPPGQFEMAKSADKVYRLLGTDGLGATSMPPENQLVDSTLGYFIRPGKHSMTKIDWKAFLDFADKHFGKPK